MQPIRDDHQAIQDQTAAVELAHLVLEMSFSSIAGTRARQLARAVLGVEDHGNFGTCVPINTNGTVRLIPKDEPVFLLRGQDRIASGVVQLWASQAEFRGCKPDIVTSARAHADKMEAWPKKKFADLTQGIGLDRSGPFGAAHADA